MKNKVAKEKFLRGELVVHIKNEEQQRKLINFIKNNLEVEQFWDLDKEFDSYIEYPYFYVMLFDDGSIEMNAEAFGEEFEIIELDRLIK